MTDKYLPKKGQKGHYIFICETCNFECSNKSKYNRHLLTAKHKILTNTDEKGPQRSNPLFFCECGKKYKHRQSLFTHQRKCNYLNQQENKKENKEEGPDYKELLMQAMKQMQEKDKLMEKMMSEMIPKIGNTNNNTTNNNFNLNFFLNERCKDALNLTDFINSIQVQLKDLEYTAENGHIQGITNIFHNALSNLEETKRPMHCTDLKREVLYIKDNNEWHKDENKEEIKVAVNKVVNKNIGNQAKWIDAHPNLEDEKEMEKYIQMQDHSLGTGEEIEQNKIVKNIMREVIIKKGD
tara:strand:- start:1791 stop:2675 length:885 start_codon:yes stop_codon:yes gene_type:complete